METKKRSKLALVLSGGSARGLAHIGVLKVLEKHHIPIDSIIGTSMGALIGGLYSAGELDKFEEEILRISKNKILSLFIANRIFIRKAKSGTIKKLIDKFVYGKKIENLDVMFTAVATDLKTGEEIFIEKGNLTKSIIASISIPGIFNPVKYGKRMLVDGGVIDPLPQKYGQITSEKVIAVNAMPIKSYYKEKSGIFDIVRETIDIMSKEIIRLRLKEKKNTLVIQLKTKKIRPFDFSDIKKIIRIGQKEAEKNIGKILKLVKGDKERL